MNVFEPIFWKIMTIIVIFWVFYLFVGFEISIITVLASILGSIWVKMGFLGK